MENKENKDNKTIHRDPLDAENAKEMEKKEISETLNRHLNDFKSICFDAVRQLEGDEYTLGTVKKLEQGFRILDNDPVTTRLKALHWNKFLEMAMELKAHIHKFTELISMLQIRYTSKKANIQVLDRIIEEFTLGAREIKVKLPPNTTSLPSKDNPIDVDIHNLREKIGYSIKELNKKEKQEIEKKEKKDGNR